MTAQTVQTCRVAAADGVNLAASLFAPTGQPRAILLISGATGAPRRYYDAFAAHAASRGLLVATYDYRGIGGSAQAAPRRDPSRMRDWGLLDLPAMLGWLNAAYPHLPILHLGHSVGGQLPGLAGNRDLIAAAASVGSQSGEWRLWPGWRKWRRFVDFHLLIPGVTLLFGHMPARLLGYDLPPGVAAEWARWCRKRGYVTGAMPETRAGFAAFRAPYLMIDISDDDYAPASCVDGLARLFSGTEVLRRGIRPAEYDLPALGHFGFFRSRTPAAAWNLPLDFLLARGV